VRSAEWEVVAVTVFESKSALERATAAVGDVVRERVRPLAAAEPERREGFVLHHAAPGAPARRLRRARPDVELAQARHAGEPRQRRK
jgi:hypothetical protein